MSITLSSDIKGNAANVAAKVIAEANADRMGGVIHQASSLAQLNAWITDETARIALDPSGFTACIWGHGDLLRVSTEAPGVYRQWDRNAGTPNALTVILPNSNVVTLAANTNTVISIDGAPSNGVGSNGDYAFDPATSTIYGPKAGGIWPAGVVLFGVGGGSGSGDVTGPSSSIAGNIAIYSGATGKVLADGGFPYPSEKLNHKLRAFLKSIYTGMTDSGGVPLLNLTNRFSIGCVGDSVGFQKLEFFVYRLGLTFGTCNQVLQAGGHSGGASAVDEHPTGTTWINGLYDSIPSGGEVTYQYGGGRVAATKIKIYYVIEPGAGTFKVQTNSGSGFADEAGYTAVDCNGVANAGIITLTKTTGSTWSVKIVGVSGTCKILFVDTINEDVYGLQLYRFDAGGQAFITHDSTPALRKTTVFNDLALDLIFSEYKDDSQYNAAFDAWVSWYDASITKKTGHIWIGTNGLAADTTVAAQRAHVKNACYSLDDHFYFDAHTPVQPDGFLTEQGWEGDGTHMSAAGKAYLASLLWERLGLDDLMMIPSPKKVSTDAISLVNGFFKYYGVGKFTNLIASIGKASEAYDVHLNFLRNLYFNDLSSTAYAIWTSVSNGLNWILRPVAFGGTSNDTTNPVLEKGGSNVLKIRSQASASTLASHHAAFFYGGSSNPYTVGYTGNTATPEGAIAANPGSLCLRSGASDGAVNTMVYVKEYNATSSGWRALVPRGFLSKSTTGGNTTLTQSELDNTHFEITGTLTNDATITFANIPGKSIVVRNATTGAYKVTVKCSSGATQDTTQGKTARFYWSGTNWYRETGDVDN